MLAGGGDTTAGMAICCKINDILRDVECGQRRRWRKIEAQRRLHLWRCRLIAANRTVGDLPVQRQGFAHRRDREFPAQHVAAGLELAQRLRALAAEHEQLHQLAVHVFAQRIAVENALRVADRFAVFAADGAQLHQPPQRVEIVAPMFLALAQRPVVGELQQDVGLVQRHAGTQVLDVVIAQLLDRTAQSGRDPALEFLDVQPDRLRAVEADRAAAVAGDQLAMLERRAFHHPSQPPQCGVERAGGHRRHALGPQRVEQLGAAEIAPASQRQIREQAAAAARDRSDLLAAGIVGDAEGTKQPDA